MVRARFGEVIAAGGSFRYRQAVKVLIAGLLLATVACHADRALIEEGSVAAVPGNYWSGNEAPLVSSNFRGADALPLITFGAETLAVRAGGTDTVFVTLPVASGTLSLQVAFHDGSVVHVPISVYGFRRTFLSVPLDEDGFPWPADRPTITAIRGGALRLFDVTTNNLRSLNPDWVAFRCGNDVATPSAADARLLVVPLACGWYAATPQSGGATPDTIDVRGIARVNAIWYMIHLRPGAWLAMAKETLIAVTRTVGAPALGASIEGCGEAYGFAVSPRGDRVAMKYCRGGAVTAFYPVIATATSGVAFRLPLVGTGGAGFSPDGDTLFVTGDTIVLGVSAVSVLLAVDAASGAILRRVAAPASGSLMDVVVDPSRPFLYLTQGNAVYVYDRATLTQVAILRAPGASVPDPGHHFLTLIDPFARRLYTWSPRVGAPASGRDIAEFSLTP